MAKKPLKPPAPRVSVAELVSNPMAALPAIGSFVARVGVPSAIALGMFWWLTSDLSTRLGAIEAALMTHKIDTASIAAHMTQESEQSWVIVGTLSRICINTAKTDADRLSCVSVPRRPQ